MRISEARIASRIFGHSSPAPSFEVTPHLILCAAIRMGLPARTPSASKYSVSTASMASVELLRPRADSEQLIAVAVIGAISSPLPRRGEARAGRGWFRCHTGGVLERPSALDAPWASSDREFMLKISVPPSASSKKGPPKRAPPLG